MNPLINTSILFILLNFISCSIVLCQIDSESPKLICNSSYDSLFKKMVFRNVEKMPNVIEGGDSLFAAINKVQFKGIWNKQESKVIVEFVVDENGFISDKSIIQDCGDREYAENILAKIEQFHWEPGVCNNKFVPVVMRIPIQLEFK